ncbi:MAG TPA: type IV secretion system protein [Steroidobacteraceae bacterium]|jgi:type IV secretion system protein VirB6
MAFFQTFWSWLNSQLTNYIGSNTASVSTALEPAIVTLAVLYVMAWGFLQLTGRIDEPVVTGLKRIITLAVVLAVALRLWLYNSVIVDTFYHAPSQLAAAVVGSSDPVGTVDAIWNDGGAVAEQLWNRGSLLNGELGFYLMGAAVWLLMGLLCVYVMFLIALSSVALAVLLAVGPLFIVLLLFDTTRRLFDAWLAQLVNYALITILTVLVAALLLQVVSSYALQTAARGSALLTVDALDMVLMAILALLLMRQVMPIAASLAEGISLHSLGTISSVMARGVRRAGIGGRLAATAAVRGGMYVWNAHRREVAPPTATSWRDSEPNV